MKKVVLAAIAVFAFATSNAQDLKFGAKAGVNLANLTTDYSGDDDFDSDNKMKVGFHAGGFVEIKFSEKLALQPELLFSLQGTKTEENENDFGDGFSSESESSISLSYINIPVMVKFYPIGGLFIEAGPQVGFLVSAKAKTEGSFTEPVYDENFNIVGSTTTSEDTDVDVKDFYKSIDFGVNVGVGYEFTENLFANVRYNIGLSDISDEPDDIDFGVFGDLFKTRNSVLSLSVGFKF